jgi:poly(rC)-binding protein 2/3/4
VIGKGGNIIKALRQETGARIKIANAVPGVDERVIIISAPERDRAHGRDRERGRDREGREKERASRERDGGRERERDRDVRDRDDKSRKREILSPAQEALFRVHGRIVDAELPNQVSDEDEEGSGSVTTRLLVPNNQIGCLLGKGGKIIEQMREETGAQIRILPKEQLPGCAVPSDELVQVMHLISVFEVCKSPEQSPKILHW